MNVRAIIKWIVDFLKDMRTVNRENATNILEYEIDELENIFALLLFGSFIGLPSPPVYIALPLLALMEKEITMMYEKINVAHDALASISGVLGEP